MPMFETAYRLPRGGGAYTTIYARNAAHADETVNLRGMDEKVIGPPMFASHPEMPSDLLRRGRFAAAQHAAIWVGMIAVKARIVGGFDLMADDGLIHQLAHVAHSREDLGRIDPYQVSRLAAELEVFERRVPGLHRSWADGPDRYDPYLQPRWIGYDIGIEAEAMLKGASFEETKELTRQKRAANKVAQIGPAEPAKAPKAKPGTRAFAEAQRAQGQAVKADQRRRLVDKLKGTTNATPPAAIARRPDGKFEGIMTAAVAEAAPALTAETLMTTIRQLKAIDAELRPREIYPTFPKIRVTPPDQVAKIASVAHEEPASLTMTRSVRDIQVEILAQGDRIMESYRQEIARRLERQLLGDLGGRL